VNRKATGGADEADRLAASLLGGAAPGEASTGWTAYSRPAAVLLSLFIGYHAVTLVLHNLTSLPAVRAVHAALDRPLGITSYMAVNGNPRGWGLFAPNANQANYFTKVLIEDSTGRQRDLQVDMYGRRSYPYLFYDRLANLNRRTAQAETSLRPFYAAWACRYWERTHGGEPAQAAVLVRRWTRIPAPETVYGEMGYHPMGLYPNEDQITRFDCATTPGGRMPNDLRRRFALPARPEPSAAAPEAPSEAAESQETSRDGY